MHDAPHYSILSSHLFLQLKSLFIPQLPFLDYRQFIFSVNMADQVSRIHKTSKIVMLIFSVVLSGHNKRDEKRFSTEWLLGMLLLIESFINISISIFY